jgi:hypothetical protein
MDDQNSFRDSSTACWIGFAAISAAINQHVRTNEWVKIIDAKYGPSSISPARVRRHENDASTTIPLEACGFLATCSNRRNQSRTSLPSMKASRTNAMRKQGRRERNPPE